jgi:circadian clock protein KaiB
MSRAKKNRGAPDGSDGAGALELSLHPSAEGNYLLRLYVSGMTPNSQRAIENIRAICAEHLAGRYRLEIIDIYQNPICAMQGQIVAAPTLIKELPPPLRQFVGDMSQTERIVLGLDIRTER